MGNWDDLLNALFLPALLQWLIVSDPGLRRAGLAGLAGDEIKINGEIGVPV